MLFSTSLPSNQMQISEYLLYLLVSQCQIALLWLIETGITCSDICLLNMHINQCKNYYLLPEQISRENKFKATGSNLKQWCAGFFYQPVLRFLKKNKAHNFHVQRKLLRGKMALLGILIIIITCRFPFKAQIWSACFIHQTWLLVNIASLVCGFVWFCIKPNKFLEWMPKLKSNYCAM